MRFEILDLVQRGYWGLEPTSKQEVSGGLEPFESKIFEAESVFIVAVRVSPKELSL